MNKKQNFLSILITGAVLASCSHGIKKNIQEKLVNNEDQFRYTDKNGQYLMRTSSGMDKDGKSFSTKKRLEIPNRQKDNILEQSVTVSSLGTLKKKVMILRPKTSQYSVWFDGKKYSSEMKINPKKKSLEIKMVSPESQWNGVKQIPFPNSTVIPCFFSQIIECAKVSGFISKATEKKSGQTSFMIVWEGYPYLNETFSDFPSELFSQAELEYDGITKDAERRFNLRVAGQSIFYILNDKDVMIKMFWVSQGISMTSKTVKDSPEQNEGGDIE